MRIALAALVLAALLGTAGVLGDRAETLPQPLLWLALQIASLGGAALGASLLSQRFADRRWLLVLAVFVGWRLAYFPIMVFSGHVASIAEWLELRAALPVAIWPVFLLSVAAIHGVAALGAGWLVRPPHRLFRLALVPAFAVATAVSFSSGEDLHPVPDRALALGAPIPATREARWNPYLPVLGSDDYAAHVNVMLLAAGLTYETIPESPWARTVKAVLEGLFHENPVASTHDRVVEHYLAYHAAQRMVGCRDLALCPAEPMAVPPAAARDRPAP